MSKRAVITGIGVVAPSGIGTEAHWTSTREGTSAISRITSFEPGAVPVRVAGQIPDFNAEDFIDRRLMVQTDRWTWMALAAGQMALDDAAFDPETQDPYSMCVITASSSGGNEFGQKEIQNLWAQGPKFVGAYQSIAWFYATTTGQLSIKHGMKGHCGVFCTEGTGGLESMSQSRKAINRGFGSVLAGGTEAAVAPYAAVCQTTVGSYSAQADPTKAYRPFDAAANGYVTGEGGAILLVEELDAARERGAPRVYGEVIGYAATHDAHHVTHADPSGHYLGRAASIALERAGISAADVDVVFADAAGTLDGDLAEARALTAALGGRATEVPVTAPKSQVGRLYAGGASLDVATALLAMRDGVIPPTVNVDDLADGVDLNLVRDTAQTAEITNALLLARGSGGFNAALVLRNGASLD